MRPASAHPPAHAVINVHAMSHAAALASAAARYDLAGPFRYVFIAFTMMIVGWYWLSRDSPFRIAAQSGGWRFAIAVVASAGMLTFGISVALGQLAIGITALIVTGLPAMFLVAEWFRSQGNWRPKR
jgi:hypothetical protein